MKFSTLNLFHAPSLGSGLLTVSPHLFSLFPCPGVKRTPWGLGFLHGICMTGELTQHTFLSHSLGLMSFLSEPCFLPHPCSTSSLCPCLCVLYICHVFVLCFAVVLSVVLSSTVRGPSTSHPPSATFPAFPLVLPPFTIDMF